MEERTKLEQEPFAPSRVFWSGKPPKLGAEAAEAGQEAEGRSMLASDGGGRKKKRPMETRRRSRRQRPRKPSPKRRKSSTRSRCYSGSSGPI